MPTKNTYTYIGIFKPIDSTPGFFTSLFIDIFGNYFLQIEDDEKIIGFKEIKVYKRKILLSEQKIVFVKEGDSCIFSFVYKKKLFYGNRNEIEQDLTNILYTHNISVQTKLLISAFLNLYQKTIDLIQILNDDLSKQGMSERLSEDIPFIRTKEINREKDNTELLPIDEYYSRLNEINKNIRPEDITYFKNDKAYFKKFSFDVDMIVNEECLLYRDLEKIISNTITFCADKDINVLKKLIENPISVNFILKSRDVDLIQQDVESLVSEKVKDKSIPPSISIFDIGLNLDFELHPIKEYDSCVLNLEDDNRENELQDCVNSIISNFNI